MNQHGKAKPCRPHCSTGALLQLLLIPLLKLRDGIRAGSHRLLRVERSTHMNHGNNGALCLSSTHSPSQSPRQFVFCLFSSSAKAGNSSSCAAGSGFPYLRPNRSSGKAGAAPAAAGKGLVSWDLSRLQP